MSSLPFFEYGATRLDDIIRPDMVCAFDFDGTLAPIVKEPDQVCVPVAVLRRLTALSAHVPVAIITGRSVADLRAHLDFEPDYIIGNHGIEGVPGWELRSGQYQQLCQSWKQQLTTALQDRTQFDPGIRIEDKSWTLSVHYRLARDPLKAEAQLAQWLPGLMPAPHIVAGKRVFNLLPPDAGDKGSALNQLCAAIGATSAVYVGDDVTDEDVFRLRRPDWLTVRIERDEHSAAEFYLHHRLGMVQLLDELIARLSKIQSLRASLR